MDNYRKGLTLLIFVAASLLILGAVGLGYLAMTQDDIFACPEEIKRCPDGGFVGRTDPFCNFPKCPSADAVQQKRKSAELIFYCAASPGEFAQDNPAAYQALSADYESRFNNKTDCALPEAKIGIAYFTLAGSQAQYFMAFFPAAGEAGEQTAIYEITNGAASGIIGRRSDSGQSFDAAYVEKGDLAIVSKIASGGTRTDYFKEIAGLLREDKAVFNYSPD